VAYGQYKQRHMDSGDRLQFAARCLQALLCVVEPIAGTLDVLIALGDRRVVKESRP
jgi:hypothetical protein